MAREGTALRAGRAAGAGVVKVNESKPPSSKRPVSAASIFKQQQSKAVKNSVVTPVLHTSAMKKWTQAKRGSSSSPEKMGSNDGRKQDDLHPLAAAFNDTARAYRQTLLESTTRKLDDTLSHLLDQLNDFNITTSSSPPQASDPNDSPQRLTIADRADRTAKKLFTPLGQYELTVARNDPNGEEYRVVQKLEDGLVDYQARHEHRIEEIRKLEVKWETVVGEIWKVGINCLGEDAMSALLLIKPAPPPSPPAKAERYSLMLADLDPRPVRKKVKFEESAPKLPRFLTSASRYADLPIPKQISKDDIKMLTEKVNDFGTEQIEALTKVKKDGEIWWEKKQAQMMIALQED
ncbi:uncharacterized protein CC84DRAFT_1144413 [Paraphaeosphaeria sporulosa]|uniref:Uncharacterized protein n=1 Tax=Paraphaeosphaeria sporulosa TaxID=1460663 RepID=A0A177CLM8_9PLEO|nr:uncharacterized protein CC84DRAFT_1144413 [Paraphaeosphaeria sporulosa]OAG07687.1 hypothetical protein CC84DRAFT_1144413 [Paraphaeosphaeria sporulosa]